MGAGVYTNPKEMIDPVEAAHKLKQVLPRMDERGGRSACRRKGVRLSRAADHADGRIGDQRAGHTGNVFEPGEKRHYPLGRVAAQVLGGVDVDSHGVAGVERAFEKRLETNSEPLRLSIDVRVQAVMRDELQHSKDEFQAIGACGIVMDVLPAK